jgi:hypothetical protein
VTIGQSSSISGRNLLRWPMTFPATKYVVVGMVQCLRISRPQGDVRIDHL